jgi:hypothetical protein
MPKALKNIAELPLTTCPLCGTEVLSLKVGQRGLLGKKPDAIMCGNCTAIFKIDGFFRHTGYLQFDSIPDPYSLFDTHLQGWVKIGSVSHLGRLISTNSPEALSYLSGPSCYLWRVRLAVGATGPAESLNVEFKWETENEAKKLLAEIRHMQKELRQIKREMNLEMKKIRAKYGRSKEMAEPKKLALLPYAGLAIAIDNALLQMDRHKLSLQEWIEGQE